ncbi:MAG TPA: NUDIX domain-containing protein [Tepidisphaeraceae bacterium]|nr:NUDIX domain-containing protein [Tepidisphaeraceae bacterium]
MEKLPTIRIAAAIINNERGQTLLVRKHSSQVFIQPGGKINSGETELAALYRELKEELNCVPIRTRFCGHFSAPAANEAEHVVEAAIYWVDIEGPVAPASEIAEIIWVDPKDPGDRPIAPLTREHVLPIASASMR